MTAPTNHRSRLAALVLAAALGAGLLPGTAPPAGAADDNPAARPRPVAPRGPLGAEEKSTITLFERARGSVVYISTSERVQDLWSRNVFSVPRGTGSGFVWDDNGHVITNHHVIEGASEASVKLADGKRYKARLIGTSPQHDIAVLRIDTGARKPEPLPLGSSADLRVGQQVFAIGNPFGLDWTLTRGIISALDRSLAGERGNNVAHLIQTDAAINPGNSGGPLLDSAGRLIGINTAIFSPSGASAGIGFAVPVDTVNRVVPQLIQRGKYLRPSLGLELDDTLNQRLTSLFNIEGVVVLDVPAGSAAARAGLRGATVSGGDVVLGDVITAVNGRPVERVGKLLQELDDQRVGDTVRLTVMRQGKAREVTVALQAGE